LKKVYDVLIVGAGPAGMFAANELVDKGYSILIVDMGKEVENRECPINTISICTHCKPCNIMCGVGGSGTFSDGTLNLRPDIGGDLFELTQNHEEAWNLVHQVDQIYLKYGANSELNTPDESKVMELKRTAASLGARFVEITQRHMGSDKAPQIISNFERDLRSNGVEILLNAEVLDLKIKNGVCDGVVLRDGRELNARRVLLAPGRIGSQWVGRLVEQNKIKAKNGPIDVGIRVEIPALVMDPVTNINRDPKFHIRTKTYDDLVRTFCTNAHGFVVKEEYPGFIAINGHSFADKRSDNTNFAFIVRIELTHPLENTTDYGKSIAKLATTIGGGKPVLQRLGDLRRGRRSTQSRIERNTTVPTLKDYTPGDISMALPHRIVMAVIEGLEVLNQIIPGGASYSTLLYAPEVKFYAMQLQVDERMETSICGLFAAGDGCGLSRDIVNASATGILAARGLLQSLRDDVKLKGQPKKS